MSMRQRCISLSVGAKEVAIVCVEVVFAQSGRDGRRPAGDLGVRVGCGRKARVELETVVNCLWKDPR
jgi:hypothetical protein